MRKFNEYIVDKQIFKTIIIDYIFIYLLVQAQYYWLINPNDIYKKKN